MRHIVTKGKRDEFAVLHATRSVQAAWMTLEPGDVSDEQPSNEHPKSEQWVFVASGSGQATIGKKRSSLRKVKIAKGSLLLIEKGELHQIKNTGLFALVTLNFYTPPAYGKDGKPKPTATSESGRRRRAESGQS